MGFWGLVLEYACADVILMLHWTVWLARRLVVHIRACGTLVDLQLEQWYIAELAHRLIQFHSHWAKWQGDPAIDYQRGSLWAYSGQGQTSPLLTNNPQENSAHDIILGSQGDKLQRTLHLPHQPYHCPILLLKLFITIESVVVLLFVILQH